MIGRAAERERSQGGIKMDETGYVVVRPTSNVVVLDREGVDLIKGLKVTEVRRQGIWNEHASHVNAEYLRVLEQAAFAQVR